MHKRAIATTLAVLAAAIGAGTVSASAAPTSRMPDFTLYCDTATVLPTESVIIPADSLWIKSGELTGHYVILSEAHFVYPGELRERPSADLYTQPLAPAKTFGAKTALQEGAINCDFVSYWASRDLSIIGPITIAKVSG